MLSVSATALSGFNASQLRLQTAANNIANANTASYRAQDVVQTSVASGGVNAQVVERNPATVQTTDGRGNLAQRPNVSLEEEVIQADFSTYSAQANLKLLQVQNQLDEYLLDIQA